MQRFEQLLNETARQLEPVEAAAFRQVVELQRERLFQEYQANPIALKQRLERPLGVDALGRHYRQASSEFGQIAIDTAVRATLWQGIAALFRLGR